MCAVFRFCGFIAFDKQFSISVFDVCVDDLFHYYNIFNIHLDFVNKIIL